MSNTTFLRSSKVAEALGSIVLMTQLHDVRNFSAYLDKSAAEISGTKDQDEKHYISVIIKFCKKFN